MIVGWQIANGQQRGNVEAVALAVAIVILAQPGLAVGRQLDGAISGIAALPAIVDAVGDKTTVLVDGGFRRGTDIIKALALGAKAVLIGRPQLWGVASAGEEGVLWVLELFQREIDRAMALGGWDSLARINRSILQMPD